MGIYGIYWIAEPAAAFDNLLTTQGADTAYRLSPYSRMRFVTDATSADLDIVSDIQGTYPTLGANWYRSELTVTSAYGALAASGVAWTATGGFSGLPPWFVFLRVAS